MDRAQQQEQFSNAYLEAVASVAGYSLSKPGVDDDSIDWSINKRGGQGTIQSPRIEVQLKSKLIAKPINSDNFNYDLKVKNYQELISDKVLVPRILILVIIPELFDHWLQIADNQTVLKYCGYWKSLRGEPPTSNKNTVRISIPKSNLFTPQELTKLMDLVGNEGVP